MQSETLTTCPLSNKIFFDPVYLNCGHVFEKETLQDYLAEKLFCPECHVTIHSEKEIQAAEAISREITEAIETNQLSRCNQYLPRYILFNLLTGNNLTMPLSQIEEILKKEAENKLQKQEIDDNLFCDIVRDKKDKLITFSLKIKPQRMAYFLWQSIQDSQLKTIAKKLIDLKSFNEKTINQFITVKVAHRKEIYSVSYLLLSNVEGREILKENGALCTLIAEKLTEEQLQQFVHEDTAKGILYYLLIDEEVGQTMLKEQANLREKLDNLGETFLAKQIVEGPHKGKSLQDLYQCILPTPQRWTNDEKMVSHSF